MVKDNRIRNENFDPEKHYPAKRLVNRKGEYYKLMDFSAEHWKFQIRNKG
jgi:hypothetical protein